MKDDGFIFSKHDKIARRVLLAKDEVFHGDLLKEKQKSSVLLPLLNLVFVDPRR